MANAEGKTIIITGASDGIGKAAARELSRNGANVILHGRSPEKTKAIADELGVPYYVADFTRLREVRELGGKLLNAHPRIDVLINNAGGIFAERVLTEDGYEKTFQVNHLAGFLLTIILLENLIASRASVINTSSIGNQYLSKLDINDLNLEHGYTFYRAYGNAKLANILFAKELHRRYGSRGISAASFHPGNVASNFGSESISFIRLIYKTPLRHLFNLLFLISPEKGADTMVWLATTKPGRDWQPGEYYVKRTITKAHKLAYDESIARSLWEQSEKMVGNFRGKYK